LSVTATISVKRTVSQRQLK